jgi:hypothetical protein
MTYPHSIELCDFNKLVFISFLIGWNISAINPMRDGGRDLSNQKTQLCIKGNGRRALNSVIHLSFPVATLASPPDICPFKEVIWSAKNTHESQESQPSEHSTKGI